MNQMNNRERAVETLRKNTQLGPVVCESIVEILDNEGILAQDMDYEYAVQVETYNGRFFVYTEWVNDEGVLSLVKNPRLADWMPERKVAESFAKDDAEQFGTTARVVRRLVSEPEEDVNEK